MLVTATIAVEEHGRGCRWEARVEGLGGSARVLSGDATGDLRAWGEACDQVMRLVAVARVAR